MHFTLGTSISPQGSHIVINIVVCFPYVYLCIFLGFLFFCTYLKHTHIGIYIGVQRICVTYNIEQCDIMRQNTTNCIYFPNFSSPHLVINLCYKMQTYYVYIFWVCQSYHPLTHQLTFCMAGRQIYIKIGYTSLYL